MPYKDPEVRRLMIAQWKANNPDKVRQYRATTEKRRKEKEAMQRVAEHVARQQFR